MLHIVESTKPHQVVQDLGEAVARHKFGVLGIHDLKETLANEANLEISPALPCRISQ